MVSGAAGAVGAAGARGGGPGPGAGGGECPAYAEQLNARWRAGAEAFPGGGLEAWLADHGVLLTMCAPAGFPPVCGHEEAAVGGGQLDHTSASWVGQTGSGGQGPYVFPAVPWGVGRVVAPERVRVECLYPSDGATISRDGSGCGPQGLDPYFGSQGFARAPPAARKVAVAKLEQRLADFGKSPDEWADVGCADFFKGSPIVSMGNSSSWTPADQGSMGACEALVQAGAAGVADAGASPAIELINSYAEDFAPFLGHPPCHLDAGVPCEDGVHCAGFWVWNGACSWPPSAFEQAKQAQLALMERGSPEVLLWNELVLDATDPARNASSPEAVEATFWVMYPGLPDPVYAYLQQAARIAGRKAGPAAGVGVPVLRVTPTADAAAAGRLFSCDEEAPAVDGDPEEGAALTAGWLARGVKVPPGAAGDLRHGVLQGANPGAPKTTSIEGGMRAPRAG